MYSAFAGFAPIARRNLFPHATASGSVLNLAVLTVETSFLITETEKPSASRSIITNVGRKMLSRMPMMVSYMASPLTKKVRLAVGVNNGLRGF